MKQFLDALSSMVTDNPQRLPVSSRVTDAVPVKGTNIRAVLHHSFSEKEAVDFARNLTNHPALRFLENARYNVLDIGLIYPFSNREGEVPPPDKARITLYDYTTNRGFEVMASFPDGRNVKVTELREQPFSSEGEFQQAIEILMADPKHGAPLREGKAFCTPGMPPVLDFTAPLDSNIRFDGVPIGGKPPANRTLALVMNFTAGNSNGQVGHYYVDMIERKVAGFGTASSDFFPAACGGPPSGGSCSTTSGTSLITIQWPQTNPIWTFQILRPSATTGDQPAGSGVEIRNVFYRGKRVLKRAGMPVLNVFYDGNACGPYRDWLYSETCFDCALGTDLGSGVRWGVNVATICDDVTDAGAWRGVAVYESNGELVLVSECSAGWYRYITAWYFTQNGIIKPRFLYGYTESGCVCYGRLHNAYWRLDFDLNGTDNQVVEETDSTTHPNWRMIRREAKLYRRNPRGAWRVRNTMSGEVAEIRANAQDGQHERLNTGRGDLWVLRYKGTGTTDSELNGSSGADANLDQYVNYEDITNQNVVLWYGVHQRKRGADPFECPPLGPDIILRGY